MRPLTSRQTIPVAGRLPRALCLVPLLLAYCTGLVLGAPELGHFSLAFPPAKALTDPLHLGKRLPGEHAQPVEGVRSLAYLMNVGGIALGAVAHSADGTRLVGLGYDPGRPDGQRLVVTVETIGGARKDLVAPLPDWQLLPIVSLAAGDQQACVTLFGELVDPGETARVRARNGYIVNYHPALADTLLGLRIFQADMLLLHPATCDLPKDGGAYILGTGEVAPDVEGNALRLERVQSILEGVADHNFRSYLICDAGQAIGFRQAGDELAVTGRPYWAFWRLRSEDEAEIGKVEDEANDAANKALRDELAADGRSMSDSALREKYSKAYQTARHTQVWDEIVSAKLLVSMAPLSDAVSEAVAKQEGINPAVYSALSNVMRYAAVFRHCRETIPDEFRKLQSQVKDVRPIPKTTTPTVVDTGSEE